MVLAPLLSLLAPGALVGCGGSAGAGNAHEAPAPARLTPDEVEQRLASFDGSFYVFDANPRGVYDAAHLPGATFVPPEGVSASLLPADKAASLVFYCANER